MGSTLGSIGGGVGKPALDFTYQSGGMQGPSTATVTYLGKATPSLSFRSPSTLRVGSLSMSMYPVEYSITESNSGDMTVVTYSDGSFILDKIQIGLKYSHGLETQFGKPLIIVGKEIDPCLGIAEDANDPCSPCKKADGTPIERKLNCLEQKARDIPDVDYSLTELKDAVKVKIDTSKTSVPTNYRVSYVGSLRDVLNNIARDLGFVYRWDGAGVVFKSIRSPESLPIPSLFRVLEKTKTKSLLGTSAKGGVAKFVKEGSQADYECDKDWAKKLSLTPVHLEDVFSQSAVESFYGSYDRMFAMCCLSNYGAGIRNYYNWFLKEGVVDADAARAKISDPPFSTMGNFKIKEVYDKGAQYSLLLDRLGDVEKQKAIENGAYFVLAKVSEAAWDATVDNEVKIAREFLGKFFIRRISSEKLTRDGSQILSPGADNVKIFDDEEPSALPFLDKLIETNEKAQDFLSALRDPSSSFTSGSFVLVEREGVWYPPATSEEGVSMNALAELSTPKSLGKGTLSDESSTDEGEFYFICYPHEANKIVIDSIDVKNHPTEREHQTDSAFGYSSEYGLKSRSCAKIGISSGNQELNIHSPAQAYQTLSASGYTIILKKEGSLKTSVEIPKRALFENQLPDLSSDAASVEIEYIDKTSSILKYMSYSDPDLTCRADENAIRAALEESLVGLSASNDEPFEELTYQVSGFPDVNLFSSFNVEGISVRYGPDGVTSTIKINNHTRRTPNKDDFYKKIIPYVKPFGSKLLHNTGGELSARPPKIESY